MKDIKVYLHLYIGCEVARKHDGGEVEYAKLVGICQSESEPDKTVSILDVGLDYFHEWYVEETVPILRPLSDMTEEEMVEFVCLQHNSIHTNIDRTEITKIRWAYENSSNGINATWFKRCGTGASVGSKTFHINQSDPDQFKFLLSKGFDLFGLIDAGLAINKAELKP